MVKVQVLRVHWISILLVVGVRGDLVIDLRVMRANPENITVVIRDEQVVLAVCVGRWLGAKCQSILNLWPHLPPSFSLLPTPSKVKLPSGERTDGSFCSINLMTMPRD